MEDKISEILLKQRIRNRIIEYFESISKKEYILEYQKNVPIAWVAAEIFAQWYDFVDINRMEWYSKPVFSDKERNALISFWETIETTSEAIDIKKYKLEELLELPEIENMINASKPAFEIFNERGRFDEEKEEDFRLTKFSSVCHEKAP